MKYMLTMLASVALASSAWADTYTLTITKKGSLTELTKVTRVINNTTDKVTLTGNAVSKYPNSTLSFSGPHKAYTDDGKLAGIATYTDGGSGGGIPPKHDDGPLQVQPLDLDAGVAIGVEGYGFLDNDGFHAWTPSWHPGMFWIDPDGNTHLYPPPAGFMGNDFKFMFRDNLTGNWTTYVINIPLISGTVTFTGSSIGGYGVDSYTDIKVGSFIIGSGPKAPTSNAQLMKSEP